MMSLCYYFHSEVGAIIRAECIAEHLEEENKFKHLTYIHTKDPLQSSLCY